MSYKLIDINVVINGVQISRNKIRSDMKLNMLLHEDSDVGLTGTKISCGKGLCGACKVACRENHRANYEIIRACLTNMSEINGKEIVTVEGIGSENNLHPLQKAFLEDYAFQCGYCTPGFLMAGFVLIDNLKFNPINSNDLDDKIKNAISNNICRCASYNRYFDCIKKVIIEDGNLVSN